MFNRTVLAATAVVLAGSAHAESVEVYVVDMLDNIQNGYCLDIAKGQGENANPDDGLQAHTCYSYRGEIGSDQTFSTSRFESQELYMPDFDVCATAESLEAGSGIGLTACNGSDLQKITFSLILILQLNVKIYAENNKVFKYHKRDYVLFSRNSH